MDELRQLDEEDIYSVCVLERVDSETERRRLLRGLCFIRIDAKSVPVFFRVIGKKLTSNDPEKVLAGAEMLCSICHNLWARLAITMYSKSMTQALLDWIPKVRMQNWNASMNRPICDALYHISRFASHMKGSSPWFVVEQCKKMLCLQNLTISGQTLLLDILLRFGIPYIFSVDISKLHAVFTLGPEFPFFINARNSRLPLAKQPEPYAARAYLDFGNTWFKFLYIYYYRALNEVKVPNEVRSSPVTHEQREVDEFDSRLEGGVDSIRLNTDGVQGRLFCVPCVKNLVDFNFFNSLRQSEHFFPFVFPVSESRNISEKEITIRNRRERSVEQRNEGESPAKVRRVADRVNLNRVVRMLASGTATSSAQTSDLPSYARDADTEHSQMDAEKRAPEPSLTAVSQPVSSKKSRAKFLTDELMKAKRAPRKALSYSISDIFDVERLYCPVIAQQISPSIAVERNVLELLIECATQLRRKKNQKRKREEDGSLAVSFFQYIL